MISINPDVTVKNFSGQVEMVLACRKATSTILLHAQNSTDLEQVRLSADAKVINVTRKGDILVLNLDKQLRRGNQYLLRMQYRNQFAATGDLGFWTDHDKDVGRQRTAYVKFFQPDGARRAFPCFDEPDAKATFNVSILHPASLTARSNMPLLTSQDRGGGLVLDTFEETPLMSTYLVSWVVSDYKHKTNDKVTVWGARYTNDEGMTRALDIAHRSLEFCEKFLRIEYPLPKLDLFATPSFPVGGMEDWGIIMAKEQYIFGDDEAGPLTQVILHEIVHQWIGDVMTTTWWNDVWVQEAPTYYLGILGSKFLDPNDTAWDELAIAAFEEYLQRGHRWLLFPENSTMGHKANKDLLGTVLFSSHPRDRYLIRMMHCLLGDDEFKASLSALVKKYSYKNLNGYEFLQTMTEVQKTEPKVDLHSHMLPWFESDGFPELTFHRNYQNKTITVLQAPHGNPKRHIYHIPVVYMDNRRQDVYRPLRYKDIHWITEEKGQLRDTRNDQTAIVLNPGMIGWYAVNYDSRNWALIGQYLAQNPKMADQFLLMQLLYSVRAFYDRGEANIDSLLWVWEGMKGIADLTLWYSWAFIMTDMDAYFAGFKDNSRYQTRALEIWNLAATTSVSWSSSSGASKGPRSDAEKYAKDILCDLDYSKCVQLVRSAWQKEKAGLNSYQDFERFSKKVINAERAALCLIVRHGDGQTWDKIRSWIDAVKQKTLPLAVITASLACSGNEDQIKIAITDAITHGFYWQAIDPPVRYTRAVQRAFLDMFLQEGSAHTNKSDMVSLAATFVEADDDLRKYEERLQDIYGTVGGDEIADHITAARKTIETKRKDEPFFNRWLDRQLPPAS